MELSEGCQSGKLFKEILNSLKLQFRRYFDPLKA